MIRSSTAVALLLAAVSGVCLFQIKHRAELLDAEVARTLREIAEARERIALLRADWALLAERRRLGHLAGKRLRLRPLTMWQLATPESLASRLPPYPGPTATAWSRSRPTPAEIAPERGPVER